MNEAQLARIGFGWLMAMVGRKHIWMALLAAGIVWIPRVCVGQDLSSVALRDIVFGSCLDKTEHPMLDRTLTFPMDLFIFLGDNIYADTTHMTVMRAKYDALKKSRFFGQLRQKTKVLATWDDHDFGANDAGASYPMRVESQRAFLDWLEVPANSPQRRQEGVYHSEVFGPVGRRVQVILLDTRYFRSGLSHGNHGFEPSGGPYVANPDPQATMLGPAQWDWLERQFEQPAELRLVISSIQFVAEFAGCEAWANLPREKERFLGVIRKSRASGVVFLSGDRHWSELSRMDGPLGYPLYDLTCSAMTQKHTRGTPTPNRFRHQTKTYHEANAGRMRIDWGRADPLLTLQIVDQAGNVQIEQTLNLSDLQAR